MPTFPVTTTPSLAQLIGAIYNYSLQIVGLCVFVMLLYAGYLMMFGKRPEAIAIMKDCAIGVILLFSAYVILNSINRGFVEFNDPSAAGDSSL